MHWQGGKSDGLGDELEITQKHGGVVERMTLGYGYHVQGGLFYCSLIIIFKGKIRIQSQ